MMSGNVKSVTTLTVSTAYLVAVVLSRQRSASVKINKITTRKHPDQVIVRVVLDTSAWKEKATSFYERLGAYNDKIDRKIDNITGRIVDLLG